jgi:hypothetical protein
MQVSDIDGGDVQLRFRYQSAFGADVRDDFAKNKKILKFFPGQRQVGSKSDTLPPEAAMGNADKTENRVR